MPKQDLEKTKNKENKLQKPKCGIVMPISAIDGCSAEHWTEVLSILRDAINVAEFEPNLVSDADDSGIIQKRIIQNLYSNEIVVCDVSGKNPNVMFELGMRLAFDKPTIIIKDDKTDYSFDTSIIEHLTYPRDLRFSKIIKFKEDLAKKLKNTFEKSEQDINYSTFLKNFGEYKVAQLTKEEVSSEKYILKALEDLRDDISYIKRTQLIQPPLLFSPKTKNLIAKKIISEKINLFLKQHKFTHKEQILIEGLEDELYDYLVTFEEVREACDGPEELRDLISLSL